MQLLEDIKYHQIHKLFLCSLSIKRKHLTNVSASQRERGKEALTCNTIRDVEKDV